MLARIGGADMPFYPDRLSKPLSIRVPESPQKWLKRRASDRLRSSERTLELVDIRTAAKSEDLDIGRRNIDLHEPWRNDRRRYSAPGRKLNASIDIRQITRSSRALPAKRFRLRMRRQGAQQEQPIPTAATSGESTTIFASATPCPRWNPSSRSLPARRIQRWRNSLPHLSAHVGERAWNFAHHRCGTSQQERLDVAREQFGELGCRPSVRIGRWRRFGVLQRSSASLGSSCPIGAFNRSTLGGRWR